MHVHWKSHEDIDINKRKRWAFSTLKVTKTKCMYIESLRIAWRLFSPHNGTHIPCQVSPASRAGQVFCGVKSVRVQHKISVGQVSVQQTTKYSYKHEHYSRWKDQRNTATIQTMRSWTVTIAELCPHSHFWSFGLVLSIEELRESPSLDSMDGIVVKPGRVAGDDDVMGLFCHVVLIFLLPFGIILHSFLFTSILPYQLQYQKDTLWVFFNPMQRSFHSDSWTDTLPCQ